MYRSKEELKEFKKYMRKAKTILARLQVKADRGNFYENFGQKEYSKFREEINNNDILSYGDKADICGYFSEITGHITPQTI